MGAKDGDEVTRDELVDGGSVATSAIVGLPEGRFGCCSICVGSVVEKDGNEVNRDGLGDGSSVMISKTVGWGEGLRVSGSLDGVNVVGADEGCRVKIEGEKVGESVCTKENDGFWEGEWDWIAS